MHETKEKVKKLCEMTEKIQDYMGNIMCSDLCDKMSTEQAREFIDMIKDLYEAEKDAWKACYYRKMVEGMEPMSDEDRKRYKDGPFGYDNWRYSSGQFAPKGHGHYAGYTEEPYISDYMIEDMRYGGMSGYSNNGRKDGNERRSNDTYGYNPASGMDARYGKAYNEWRNSRRHYTQTNAKEDKDEMDMHAKEHMADAKTSIKELWKSGDPELRKTIKQELQALIQEMPV